jgi:hypothetical protein
MHLKDRLRSPYTIIIIYLASLCVIFYQRIPTSHITDSLKDIQKQRAAFEIEDKQRALVDLMKRCDKWWELLAGEVKRE